MNEKQIDMKKTSTHTVNEYLSLKRILMVSLLIVFSFYVIYSIFYFFSESSIINSNTIEERIQKEKEKRNMMETLRYDKVQKGDRNSITQISEYKEDTHNLKNRTEQKQPRFWKQLLVNIPLTFVLVFSVLLYNRKIMSVKFNRLREELTVNIIGSFLIGFMLSTLTTFVQMIRWPDFPGLSHSVIRFFRRGWMNDLTLTAVAMVVSYLIRSLYQEKMAAVENETLRAENLRSRYEALKNQLDPHFLFNSMNTLQSLIAVDSERAEEYVQQLSTVLRYTLQKHEVVTLAEELKCTADYCRMLKIRYGDNLLFDHHIDHAKYDNYLVLPLAIQGLVENVIKHNVVSTKLPLTVYISTDDDDHLIIRNKIQPKISNEEGSGIGLANLSERYRLQWNKKVEIHDDGNEFVVTLPLKENE